MSEGKKEKAETKKEKPDQKDEKKTKKKERDHFSVGLKDLSKSNLPKWNFNSSKLEDCFPRDREEFKHDFYPQNRKPKWGKVQPVVISSSSFIPKKLIEHLMRDKKNTTCDGTGSKYKHGDLISNGQALLHTFVTPICPIRMVSDYRWAGYHAGISVGYCQSRWVILSAAVQPDLEKPNFKGTKKYNEAVMLLLCEIGKKKMSGKKLHPDLCEKIFSAAELRNEDFRNRYDQTLVSHLIWHLTGAHKRPSLKKAKIMTLTRTLSWIESLIGDPDVRRKMERRAVELTGFVLSLEILFNCYVEQLRNELSVLEACCTDPGYIYTIDPPAIFLSAVGGSENAVLFNHLQALAFDFLKKDLKHLLAIGFNDYVDSLTPLLMSKILKGTGILNLKKGALFEGEGGRYSGLPIGKYKDLKEFEEKKKKNVHTLIVHNNSDGFGQNIEYEGGNGSMDAVIGGFSDAAIPLARKNPNLLKFIV